MSQQSSHGDSTFGDLSPVVAEGADVEPMLLLDTTGSMNQPNEPGSRTPRKDVIAEAMGILVGKLAAKDSQAAAEKAAGEDAGGLMTVTFAGGQAENIGDLSPENWKEKFGKIRWEGSTKIIPGWNLLLDTYMEEFGDTAITDRPQMLGLVITDGEAEDTDEYAEEIRKAATRTHVLIGVLGFGPEHDRALNIYQEIAKGNDHVRVVSFGNTTDPTTIADALTTLLNVS